MNESEVRTRIFKILHQVAPEADLQQLDPSQNLREALDIDSFDFLKVIVALHEKFGVEIAESEYGRITTLRGMVDYLSKAAAIR